MNNLRRLLSHSVETDHLSLLPKPTRTKALDSILTRQEFEAMLKVGKNSKDKAILCLGIIGLRAGEIGSITPEWVDLSTRTIRIPAAVAKRDKTRVVPFGAINIVAEVLKSFFSLEADGVNLSRVQVWNRVKAMASRAGITHPVTPHGLRATGATLFAAAGFSITGLQAHFGWSSLKTAEHYILASGASAIADMDRHGAKVL
jgi:integrase/recombinase XerD